VRTGSGQSAIHAFGDLNPAIFLARTESMRVTVLQCVAMTGLAGAYDEEPNGARQP
jgi:hypothetical protein